MYYYIDQWIRLVEPQQASGGTAEECHDMLTYRRMRNVGLSLVVV